MWSESNEHIPDDELLLFAEKEIEGKARARLNGHIESCSRCRERLSELKRGLANALSSYESMRSEATGRFESRAFLRARLAEESATKNAVSWSWILRTPTTWNLVSAFSVLLILAGTATVLYKQQAREALKESSQLPNPIFTPGLTRSASLKELCVRDDDDVVRIVPAALENRVLQEYGIQQTRSSDFEVDYLITPGLGGADDVKNLWPEPHSNTIWNSYVKDQLEDHLHRMVCEGKIPLDQAQHEIASNWIAAYQKYFDTKEPLRSQRMSIANDVAILR